MQEHYFYLVCGAFVVFFLGTTWLVPRWLGLPGILIAHLLVLVGYFTFAGVAIAFNRYEFDGILSMIGLAIQAFLLNSVLLPLAIFACWRRRRTGPHAAIR